MFQCDVLGEIYEALTVHAITLPHLRFRHIIWTLFEYIHARQIAKRLASVPEATLLVLNIALAKYAIIVYTVTALP